MACEIMKCCQFFNDNMKELPKSAEYIQNKLCFTNHGACNRFKVFREFGRESVPPDLDPSDTEEVDRVLHYLRNKRGDA